MIDVRTKFRPNCDEILENKSDWALSLNDVQKEIEFEEILDKLKSEVRIEESFMLFFMRKKLKNCGKLI